MNEHPFPYQFIAIEGNIGAGKTTLCSLLQKRFDCKLILEQFTDNPFLPYFYQNPKRYAFQVELFFMTERHKQLQESLIAPDLFQSLTIADYFFLKTLLFARNTLAEDEFRLFQRLFQILNNTFRKPDLIVYLHRPVPKLLEQIRRRGRSYEGHIQEKYLQSLQDTYFEYFRTETEVPVLIIDLDERDFQSDARILDQIIEVLKSRYPKGMSHISWSV